MRQPVSTKAELDTFDPDEVLSGYLSYEDDDLEPGDNHSKAFWFGWRNRAMDKGRIPIDSAARQLVRELYPRAKA